MTGWNQIPETNTLPTPEQELALARLEQRISHQTAGRIHNLRVQAVGEGILLSGRTNTYYAKQLATQIALDADSSLLLKNSIEVV
ncbi:hypothetical protein [Planctomicrobium sp. SH527]|uniref:hypothetical protein n=1 Tax=Planctomicrobium sp. SH527 TaxID=3448123 RepID=UPI003F5BAA62